MLGPLIMITHQLTVADLDGEHQNLPFFIIYYGHYLSSGGGRGCSYVLKYLLLDLFFHISEDPLISVDVCSGAL